MTDRLLPTLLSEFNALYPQVSVRLIVANSAQIESNMVAPEIRAKSLRMLSLKPALKRSFQLIYPQEKFRTRLADTFIDFAKHKLGHFAV